MNNKTNFCEYLNRDENGNFIIRLGHTTYKYALGNVYIKGSGDQYHQLTNAEDLAKPWIRQNLDREISFQMRKARAIAYQSSYIPSHERKAYKRRNGLL